MLVIIGLIVLLLAVIVALIGVLGNTGPTHPLTENFSVFGYHVTGSTGALFLFGIVIGAVAMLGLSVLLAGAWRTAGRGRAARRDLERSQRETAFANRDRDALLEHQLAGATTGAPPWNSDEATAPRHGILRFGRWLRRRKPMGNNDVGGTRGPQSGSVLTETDGRR